MPKLIIALAGQIKDDKGYLHNQTTAADAELDLQVVADKLSVPVALVAEAMQDAINKADATDTIPGDGLFEAGVTKKFPIKADIWFIHLRDNIEVTAGIVARIED